jgi:hypothetical protein
MKKRFSFFVPLMLLAFIPILLWIGCKKSEVPMAPNPIVPTPTVAPITGGGINIEVVDNGKTPSGMSLAFIPPSQSATMQRNTDGAGSCVFVPDTNKLEVGTWTIIAAATPFPPYAPSTVSLAVTATNELCQFKTQPPSIQITPPAVTSYTGTSGGTFTYQFTYTQPGNLLVPVWLYMPSPAPDWSLSSSAATIGAVTIASATITVTGSQCVDQASVPFGIYAIDAVSNTSFARAYSVPQTITKSFTSNMQASWTTSGVNTGFESCGSGVYFIISGHLTITAANNCPSDVVYVSWTQGSNCCTSDHLSTPSGNLDSTACGGGSIAYTPGTYNMTFQSAYYPAINCTFMGTNHQTAIPTSTGTVNVMNVNY